MGYARPSAPITIRVPRAPSAPRKHRRSRRRSGGGGSLGKRMMGMAIGGAVVGFIEKSDVLKDIPSFPVIGKKGTVAAIAYFIAKGRGGGGIATDVALAAAVLAGHQLGKEGTISGDDEDYE